MSNNLCFLILAYCQVATNVGCEKLVFLFEIEHLKKNSLCNYSHFIDLVHS
jgi:hypothetical protein